MSTTADYIHYMQYCKRGEREMNFVCVREQISLKYLCVCLFELYMHIKLFAVCVCINPPTSPHLVLGVGPTDLFVFGGGWRWWVGVDLGLYSLTS